MKLDSHTPRRGNRYCGPWALAVLGKMDSTDEAAALLRDLTGRRAIRAVGLFTMASALERVGWSTRVVGCRQPAPTLARWLATRTPDTRTTPVLVMAGHHFIVVEGRRATCARTGEWVWIRDYPNRRLRVRYYCRLNWRKAA